MTKENQVQLLASKKNCTAKHNFQSLFKHIFSTFLLDISKYKP